MLGSPYIHAADVAYQPVDTDVYGILPAACVTAVRYWGIKNRTAG